GWLPGEFRYHVCQYEEVVSLGDHTGFEATLRLDVHTVEQVKEWVQKLKGSSGVTWRVDVTRPSSWRWLWSKESGVTHGDRPALVAIVKEMLYCQEIGSVDRLYSEARGHPVAA
ncbi:hypothetical protein KUCAC02_031857, partial [Chaenocephalus aceratus]